MIEQSGIVRLLIQNELISHITKLCGRLDTAISCINPSTQLTGNNSCAAIFELGLCFNQTLNGTGQETNCYERYDDIAITSEKPQRACHEGVWQDISSFYYDSFRSSCMNVTLDYDYESPIDDFYNTTATGHEANNMSIATYAIYLNTLLGLSMTSFLATFLSVVLMGVFLRKKCIRIRIHMNLLAAFMLRSAVIVWVQFSLFAGQSDDTLEPDLTKYDIERFDITNLETLREDWETVCVPQLKSEEKRLMLCRVYPVAQNYTILVCFFWLTCEGVYLLLLQRPQIFKRIRPFRWFLACSWILPAIIISVWTGMVSITGTECYSVDTEYTWIIEVPIKLNIIVSTIIFSVIIHDFVTKLQRQSFNVPHVKTRMSKAFLSLIPMLGIQYAILPFFDGVAWMVPVAIVLTSSHGTIVSILCCFCSSELQAAILHYKNTKINNKNLPLTSRSEQIIHAS